MAQLAILLILRPDHKGRVVSNSSTLPLAGTDLTPGGISEAGPGMNAAGYLLI